jgi:PAS domain S-box-containing protein
MSAIKGGRLLAQGCLDVEHMPDAGSLSADTLRRVYDDAPDAVLILTIGGTLAHANPAGCRMLEAGGPAALNGTPFAALLAGEYRDEWATVLRRVADGERLRWRFELLALQGAHRWIEMHVAAPSAADGSRLILAVCRDQTEYALREERMRIARTHAEQRGGLNGREAEDAGALAQARLAAIVESCDDAIIGKTLDGIVSAWNHGAERLFGYTASEAIGRSILLIVPPDHQSEEANILSRLWRGERIDHFETQRLTKGGRRIDVSLTVSPIRDRQGAIVGASSIARDVTERRNADLSRDRMLEAERYAREQAQRASLLKDEFLATLSHELRTPLTAIKAWAHLLAIGRARSDEVRQAGEVIERNSDVQQRVIDDLLDISRIVAGRLRLEPEPLDLATVLKGALDTIGPAAAAKNIRINQSIEVGDAGMRGDSARLQQVIWNVLSNAVKFTPPLGEIRVALTASESRLQVTVTDNGAGIEPEFLPRVFERFTQGDASPSRVHCGLGLGLAIAKQIVELHGGSINAHSAGKGRGATFTIELPQDSGQAHASHGQHNPAEPVRPQNLAGVTVLVVDDESDARQVLTHILADSGATVVTAESGPAALSLVDQQAPHVIVSDIGMPGMDGYELLRRIRGLPGDGAAAPAIALTAYARPKDRLNALRAGYVAHLAKPADPSQLIATVAAAAGRSGG